MRPQLRANGYSPMEERVFNALALAQAPLTSDQMLTKVYRAADRPYYARITLNTAVRRLAEKMDENREPYKIKRIKRKGARLIETSLLRR